MYTNMYVIVCVCDINVCTYAVELGYKNLELLSIALNIQMYQLISHKARVCMPFLLRHT